MSQVSQPPIAPPDPQAIQHIYQIATGYMLSAALGVAAELGVADQLAQGPRSAAELAKKSGVNEDALYRLLRALSAAGVFTENASRIFALTPSAGLLRAGVPGSVRDMVLWICGAFHFRVYAEMMHSVRTGDTLGERVMGMPVFEYLEKDPDLSARFNDAMTNLSAGVGPAVLHAYDFTGIDVLVDVAGGHGMILASILREYPKMRGILFDMEHVLAGATALDALGVRNRSETAAGNFFEAVPAGGDAYLMKHIIHDWNDERAGVILKNIRTALEGKPRGRLILIEGVLKPGNEPDLSKLIDLEMLLLPGGRERTEAEFADLLARHGFQLTRVVPTQSPLSVVEGKIR